MSLLDAALKEDIPRMKKVLKRNGINLNEVTAYSYNAFHIVCYNGAKEVAELLLNDERVEINKRGKFGCTPLYFACQENHHDIAEMLLMDPRIELNRYNTQEGISPFNFSCCYSRYEIVEHFFKYRGNELSKDEKRLGKFVLKYCDPNKPSLVNSKTDIRKVLKSVPINEAFIIGCSSGNIELVKLLYENPIIEMDGKTQVLNLNYELPNGESPFFIACQENQFEVVKFLSKDSTVDVNKKTIYEKTPFSAACEQGNLRIVEFLMANERVDINLLMNSETSFFLTCMKGHANVVRLLMADPRVDINRANESEENPFGIACWRGQADVIKLMLKNPKVDVNKQNQDGKTPFYTICERGYLNIAKLLINSGRVDVNKPNKRYETPFMCSCLLGHLDLVKLMLATQSNLDTRAKNLEGNGIIELLFDQIAKPRGPTEAEEDYFIKQENSKALLKILPFYERNKKESVFQFQKELGLLGIFFF